MESFADDPCRPGYYWRQNIDRVDAVDERISENSDRLCLCGRSRFALRFAMKARFAATLCLFLRFLLHCGYSGLGTARIIAQRQEPQAGKVRMHFSPMSETGAAVLGAMLTLTPGSTVIDIDIKHHEMLLHLLNVSISDTTFSLIRNNFERDIVVLFPPSVRS